MTSKYYEWLAIEAFAGGLYVGKELTNPQPQISMRKRMKFWDLSMKGFLFWE
jgi:hypothetical protein